MELERAGVDRRAHETGVSAATTSRMLTRHGVPAITSRQPSHRIATLSSTIVGMWTPR
jgi:alpha-acetolactate decarboxylase